jgi:drug/metabolite transporter (DMT)-like permease
MFFGEKLKKLEMISLGMVLISLIIINIRVSRKEGPPKDSMVIPLN